MRIPRRLLLLLSVLAMSAVPGAAEVCSPTTVFMPADGGPAYQIVYRTVYDQRQVTAYRIEYETVHEEQQVTSYRPVWETRFRRECYTVSKPVMQTVYRTEYHTVMQPVVSTRTEYVDQGCYEEHTAYRPLPPSLRLRRMSAGCSVDPLTGATVYQRPGLYWVEVPRGRWEVQRVWRPNLVARQVQQTTYCPQTVARQVPVQVCRYEQQQVWRNVPYQVRRMEPVQQTIRVPRCVEKRVPVTYTCRVPRVVCCRVPIDACGVPLDITTGPVIPLRPTPAVRQSETANGEAPAIPPSENVPETDERAAAAAGGVANGATAPLPERRPAPQSDVMNQ